MPFRDQLQLVLKILGQNADLQTKIFLYLFLETPELRLHGLYFFFDTAKLYLHGFYFFFESPDFSLHGFSNFGFHYLSDHLLNSMKVFFFHVGPAALSPHFGSSRHPHRKWFPGRLMVERLRGEINAVGPAQNA